MPKGKMLKSLQPYLVLDTAGFYQFQYLKDGISHFYTFMTETDRNIVMVPNGCFDLIFEYDQGALSAYLVGPALQGDEFPVSHSKQYFALRFYGGYVPSFVTPSREDLMEKWTPLNQVMEIQDHFAPLAHAISFQDRISAFLSLYYQLYIPTDLTLPKHAVVARCKELIFASNGTIRVQQLEESVGYSSRYINKLFKEQVGHSPKTFCDIVRFQGVLEYLNTHPDAKMVDVAMRFDYYDQGQMSRAFKKLAHKTPTEYVNLLKSTDYSQHVVNVPIFTRPIINKNL